MNVWLKNRDIQAPTALSEKMPLRPDRKKANLELVWDPGPPRLILEKLISMKTENWSERNILLVSFPLQQMMDTVRYSAVKRLNVFARGALISLNSLVAYLHCADL